MPRSFSLGLISLLLAGLITQLAANPTRGILGKEAPGWEVEAWAQLPSPRSDLNPADLHGKVVYLYCFQAWCPGCHKSGFPTLKTLSEHYADNEQVAFVAIQTVFEGYHANTWKRAHEIMQRYQLDIPYAQSGSDGNRSRLMSAYRTGGTPWTIIIGPDGRVRYNDFHIKPKAAVTLIDRLLTQAP